MKLLINLLKAPFLGRKEKTVFVGHLYGANLLYYNALLLLALYLGYQMDYHKPIRLIRFLPKAMFKLSIQARFFNMELQKVQARRWINSPTTIFSVLNNTILL